MNIKIREARVSDTAMLAGMLAELFSIEDDFEIDSSKQKTALNIITGGSTGGVILIAETDSAAAGMINLQKVVSTASGGFSVLMEDLYVRPEYRKRGIGTMLVEKAVQWGKEHGAVRIQLAADSRNTPALDFYSKTGFSKSNMIFHYKFI